MKVYEAYNHSLGRVIEWRDREYVTGDWGRSQWDWQKRDLLWRQVLGFNQRHVPACYGQAFAQGILRTPYVYEPLKRKFEFTFSDGSFFPLDSGGLGFSFAVARNGALEERGGDPSYICSSSRQSLWEVEDLGNLISEKNSGIRGLDQQQYCVIL